MLYQLLGLSCSFSRNVCPDTPAQGDIDFPARWTTLPLFYVCIFMSFKGHRNRDDDRYRLVIGLFGLVGMLGVAVGPFIGRLVDRLVPWYAALCSTVLQLVFQ